MTVTISTFAKQYNKETKFEYKSFVKICKLFLYKLSKEIIEKGLKVKLPYSLGEIYVRRLRTRSKSIDFGVFNKTGKVVKYSNLHTNGFIYWIYLKKGSHLNSRLYKFSAISDKTKKEIGKRGLARYIKNCDEENIPFIAYDE